MTAATKSHLSWTPIIHLSLMSTLSRSPTSLGDGMTKVSVLFAFTLRLPIVSYIINTKCLKWLLYVQLGTVKLTRSQFCFWNQFSSIREPSLSHIPHRDLIHLPQAHTLIRKSHVPVNTLLIRTTRKIPRSAATASSPGLLSQWALSWDLPG